MITIEDIKAKCHRAIELGEAATEEPWEDDGTQSLWHPYSRPEEVTGYEGEHISLGKLEIPDLKFIAHARTFSPAAAKALLASIQGYEMMISGENKEVALIGRIMIRGITEAFPPPANPSEP